MFMGGALISKLYHVTRKNKKGEKTKEITITRVRKINKMVVCVFSYHATACSTGVFIFLI